MGDASGWLVFVGAIVALAGFVWIWVNTAGDDLVVHIVVTVALGIIWLWILWFAIAVLAGIGVLGAALTFPLWRRRR